MQKILDILERNVQWIALGIGGLLMLWAAYHYLAQPVAAVKVAGHDYAPGQIATFTAQTTASEIQKQIGDQTVPDIHPTDVAAVFNQQVGPALLEMNRNPLSAVAMNSKTGSTLIDNTPQSPEGAIHLAALPVLPPAQPISATAGLSVVVEPPPANVVPANGRAAQPVAAKNRDLAWNVGFFKIKAADLKAAFAKPLNNQEVTDPNLYSTMFLQVQLQRQRATGVDANGAPVFPEGDKGVETVPPLRIYQADLKKFPAESGALKAKYDYLQWAGEHQEEIFQPAFYEVVAGTAWQRPEDAAAEAGGAAAPDNGGQNTTNPSDNPDAAPTQDAAPASGQIAPETQPHPSARGRGAAQQPSYAPDDPGRPGNGFAPGYYRGRGRNYRGFDPRMMNRGPGAFNPGNFANGGQGGTIDPLNITDDIEIWANDETVQPGQTYRYRIIYVMKNPIFMVVNVADKQLVEQFALTSKPSDWTAPVTVPEKTKFWVASIKRSQAGGISLPQVTLDLFQWVSGTWKYSSNKLLPGDQVPGTNRMIVDVRGFDPVERDKVVLLADASGEMSQRSQTTDAQEPEHNDMLADAKAAEANPAGVAPPTRGPVPPAGRPFNPRSRGRGYGYPQGARGGR